MSGSVAVKAELYRRYPLSSVALYHGATLLHFLLGGAGLWLGYNFSPWLGKVLGLLYMLLALAQMYVLMPLKVCPNCVYYRLADARCVSALNLLSRRIAPAGDPSRFARRAAGACSPNNLYMAALIGPLVLLLPALLLNFSLSLLLLFLAVLALLLFRFLVMFRLVACLHCQAKYICPQAGSMGVRER